MAFLRMWGVVWTMVALSALGCSTADVVVADGTGGAGGGGAGECETAADCPAGPACMAAGCNGGRCVYTDSNSTPPDPDPTDCVYTTCLNGFEQQEVRIGQSCPIDATLDGVCNYDGECSCAPGDPYTPHYVDPVDGVDDALHGGAPGGCAYKTLSYALSVGRAEIVVPPGTYGVASGETLPFVLTENQRLTCREVNGQRPLLTGKGDLPSWTAVVSMQGEDNGMVGCDIVGTDTPTYCVDVVGTASASGGIVLDHVDVSGCLNALRITADQVALTNSRIHDNPSAGLFVHTATQNSLLQANGWLSNGTDIVCNGPTPGLDGHGNVGPNGLVSCTSCAHCPFM